MSVLGKVLRAAEDRLPLVWNDQATVVVVGTGAGGATAARVLAARGVDVLMLEEGALLSTKSRPRNVAGALAQAMREGGTQTTSGGAPIVVLQAKCVGGSTAVNSGIIWRLPEDVREQWTREHGLGSLVDPDALARIYDAIEQDLEVTETAEAVLGGNAALLSRGSEALGLKGKPITRNAGRCEGRGECLQGCPGERRQSMDVSYVPAAMRDGARLRTHARVTRVLFRGGRAVGVAGVALHTETHKPIGRFEVHAQRVVVAAGVVHSPLILQRSGLGGLVGERFQAHPGAAVVGRFAHPVRMSYGATQGFEVPQRERGFKVESLSLPPEMLASRLPGTGRAWQERLAHLDHYAQWCAQVRMEAHGSIREGLMGPNIRFAPTVSDLRKTQTGLLEICRMMFAAGAEEVYPGINGVPEVLRSMAEVNALEAKAWKHSDVHLVASHLFGTAVAGHDAQTSVVNEQLECHRHPGLYVMDASVFPTNLGVNPQHSIMALVYHASEQMAERLPRRQAA